MKKIITMIVSGVLLVSSSHMQAFKVVRADKPITETTQIDIDIPNAQNPYILYEFKPTEGLQEFYDRSVVLLATGCDTKSCVDANKNPVKTGFDLYLVQWYDTLLDDLDKGTFNSLARKYMTHLEPIAGASTQKIFVTAEGTVKVPQVDKAGKETGQYVALPTGCSLFPFATDDSPFAMAKAKAMGKVKNAALAPIAPPKSGTVKLKGHPVSGQAKK